MRRLLAAESSHAIGMAADGYHAVDERLSIKGLLRASSLAATCSVT